MKPKPILVAVVGGSGSGKTWLCEKLCAALGRREARLSLDDFYRDRSHLPAARRARINFDHPRAIDWNLFEQVLRDCLAGKVTSVPRYDFKAHARHRGTRIFRPTSVVFVDGLWLLHRARLRALFGLTVFLRCPAKIRLERRLARDLLNRGRSAASVREQFRSTVAPMHEWFVEPQARWAQMVFNRVVGPPEVKMILECLHK
ncbi:MAG: uridine kinase [Pedosphaera sp.]|nr:uridine kinase [Pedosphaera sp.]